LAFYSQVENTDMTASFQLRGKVWVHRHSLTPPRCIAVSVPE